LLTHMCLCHKQYNLVPANGRWCLAAGKVTIGLASHWPCITDIGGSPPTGSRPRRGRWAPAYALLVEYGELYLFHSIAIIIAVANHFPFFCTIISSLSLFWCVCFVC